MACRLAWERGAAWCPGARGSGGPSGAPVRSTARSNSGSNSTTVAGPLVPLAETSVDGSPATTWALVATRPGPTTKPEPSWRYPQAWPSTLTVEAAAGRAMARARGPVGWPTGPADGGLRPANTGGKPELLRNDWTWAKTVGTGGMMASIPFSTFERWIWLLSQA